jgi:hypothetical protein
MELTEAISSALRESSSLGEMVEKWKQTTGDYPDKGQYLWLKEYFEDRR